MKIWWFNLKAPETISSVLSEIQPRNEALGNYDFSILLDNIAAFTGGYDGLSARYGSVDYEVGATGADDSSYYDDSAANYGDTESDYASYYGQWVTGRHKRLFFLK